MPGGLCREISERQRVVLIADGAGKSCLPREMGWGIDGKLRRRRTSIKRLTEVPIEPATWIGSPLCSACTSSVRVSSW